MAEAEYRLNEINRQAKDSPIIRLSMDIRNGKRVPYGKYGKFVHKINAEDLEDELLLKATKIICGKNETRRNVNKYIRKLLGYNIKSMPNANEPIIGTGNVLPRLLFNGQEWSVQNDVSNYKLVDSKNVSIRLINEINEIRYAKLIFPEDNLYKSEKKGFISEFIKDNELYPVDYGYAMTCHKCITDDTLLLSAEGIKP